MYITLLGELLGWQPREPIQRRSNKGGLVEGYLKVLVDSLKVNCKVKVQIGIVEVM